MKKTILIICLILGGCDFFTGTKIDNNPDSLAKYLGVKLPASATGINAQIISGANDHLVQLIARFEIGKDDLGRFAENLKLIRTNNPNASVSALPLLGDKSTVPWWNPPETLDQWKMQDRFLREYGDGHKISLIWVNGNAYLYKSGPY